jgi:predicted cupin superfamily sugar epimerase
MTCALFGETGGGGTVGSGCGESFDIGASVPERLTAEDVIGALDLVPHREGGYFRETYRSDVDVSTVHGKRSASTACMYLLTEKEPSRFHRLRFDEVWFYHSGALAELVLLQPPEQTERAKSAAARPLPEHRVIGPASPYALVPAGWWVAVRAIPGEQADWGDGRAPERRWTSDRRASREYDWTLVSCMVTPGFDYADFEMASREWLLRDYPLAEQVILALT